MIAPDRNDARPWLALTMGDAAGIGPEVIARAWSDPELHRLARPIVIGSPAALRRALALVRSRAEVLSVSRPDEVPPTRDRIPCLDGSPVDVATVPPGQVDPRAGRAAHDYLVTAIDLARAGRVQGITTLPLNKEALRLAGVSHPGHTEILAEHCGVRDFAMMLYVGPPIARGSAGLGVVHVTLHVPLRQVFERLTIDRVEATIRLADQALRPLTGGRPPRVAAAGLNPHAGEHGLFGDEEARIIEPAVARARASGIDAHGPIAADTLFGRALAGSFEAVVAMYHDQGHVALKTVAFRRAVNVTLGLPIVRTSVAHGTAFDIAGHGIAETDSLIEAARVAARIIAGSGGPATSRL